MKLHLFILFVILFSCSPTLHQLKTIEFVGELKNGQLQVPIKNVEEDVALLKKYGQDKKAERLIKNNDRYNQRVKDAFRANYSFSSFVFIDEQALNLQQPWIKITEQVDDTDDREINQLVFQIIENAETKYSFTQEGNSSHLSFAIKQLSQKLNQIHKKSLPK